VAPRSLLYIDGVKFGVKSTEVGATRRLWGQKHPVVVLGPKSAHEKVDLSIGRALDLEDFGWLGALRYLLQL